MIVLKEYVADALLTACEADPARELPPAASFPTSFSFRVLAITAGHLATMMSALGERLFAECGDA
ncbi:MAG: hypothetical protein E7773_11150 [Sphingomonas sp.]|uniref:hypothetical protein n=1 Tax=Sphingomonas sp. TaxID=28214 RepID=UPI0011FAE7DC|nr:hypothetical protein [Sphingomonas sp.]THD35017.1 MAG: hypothetical protein E7773_11150 [Sphingomonas sp.]